MELGSDPAYAWATIKEGVALLPKSAVPVFLGGEHSIAPPIVSGLVQKTPMRAERACAEAHIGSAGGIRLHEVEPCLHQQENPGD